MSDASLVLRTVYISPDVDNKLRVEAFDKRTSKNDLIRRYIELGMKAAEQQSTNASGRPVFKKKAAAKKTMKMPARAAMHR
jgi:hypothetical protein